MKLQDEPFGPITYVAILGKIFVCGEDGEFHEHPERVRIVSWYHIMCRIFGRRNV